MSAEPQMSQDEPMPGSTGFDPYPPTSISTGAHSITACTAAVKINEEDIDPFTYRPPLTKWDYLKVRIYHNYIVTMIMLVHPSQYSQASRG